MAGPQKPTDSLEWASTAPGANISAPTLSKRQLGWILEKPPLQYFNWWMNLSYKWQVFFEQMTSRFNQVDVSAAGSYTLPEKAGIYYFNATAGSQTAVLPNASNNEGVEITIKKVDSSANTVTMQGTIEGETNPIIDYQYTGRTVIAHNGDWYWR